MPILSLETLPWVLLAIVVARSAFTASRLAVTREQLAETHARLREALAALEARVAAPRADAKREEIDDAVRVALEVVRRDAPQRADRFTKVS